MKEYYFNAGNIKFFCKTSGRVKYTRPRFSWLYSSSAREDNHLPFRVENYYGTTSWYSELMEHRKDYQQGIDVVRRGIYRNKVANGDYY